MEGLGGVVIAVLPYVIHPKTAVLGRAVGGSHERGASRRITRSPRSNACREKSAEAIVVVNRQVDEGSNLNQTTVIESYQMEGRMQKTSAQANDCPRAARTESESSYEGVQTYIWMTEDNVVEVPFDKEHLLEVILSPTNLNAAYKCVVRNKGCGGVDRMSCEQLLPWLRANKDSLISSLLDGSYRPNPVRRVEIPKDNGNAPVGNTYSSRPSGATSHQPSIASHL